MQPFACEGRGQLADLIRAHSAFADIDAGILAALLADSTLAAYETNELLVRQGDESDRVLVLLEGTVGVVAQTASDWSR